jgi:hypothetical protein
MVKESVEQPLSAWETRSHRAIKSARKGGGMSQPMISVGHVIAVST